MLILGVRTRLGPIKSLTGSFTPLLTEEFSLLHTPLSRLHTPLSLLHTPLAQSNGLLVFSALGNHTLNLILEVAEDEHVRGQILFGADAITYRVEVLPSVHGASRLNRQLASRISWQIRWVDLRAMPNSRASSAGVAPSCRLLMNFLRASLPVALRSSSSALAAFLFPREFFFPVAVRPRVGGRG